MYNPLAAELVMQELQQRADEMRRARTAAVPARRWWRAGRAAGERRAR